MTAAGAPADLPMIRRLLTLTALIAVPATASAAVVNAGERVGTFDAQGSGTLTMQGKMTAFGKATGSITIRDVTGSAVVKLNGVRQKPRIVRAGTAKVRVYTSSSRGARAFYVAGTNVRLAITAPLPGSLSISMFGKARIVRMSGIGTYSVNSGAEASWSEARGAITVAPLRPEPVPPAKGGPKAPKSVEPPPPVTTSEQTALVTTDPLPTAPPPVQPRVPAAAPALDHLPTLPVAAGGTPQIPTTATDRQPDLPVVATDRPSPPGAAANVPPPRA